MKKRKIQLSSPAISPEGESALVRVYRSGRWSLGPETSILEFEFAAHVGARFAVAVSSGTAALECLGRFAFESGMGSRLTFPASTFRATWNGVARGAGLHIPSLRLVDGPVVGGPARATVDAWLFGAPRDAGGVRPVIADLCEYPNVGGHAQANPMIGSAYGFYPNKLIAAGEGGMICTDRVDVRDFALDWRNHGRSGAARCPTNARITEFAAALARVQLASFKARRNSYADLHLAYLRNIPRGWAIVSAPGSFALVALAPPGLRRARAALRLAGAGIEASTAYFPCACMIPWGPGSAAGPCAWPMAHDHAARHLALPMHSGLRPADVRAICRVLRK